MQGEGKRAGPRNTPGRPEPHQHAGDQRHSDGKSERDKIDARFLETRNGRGAEREDGVETPDREQHSGERAEQRKDGAFGEHLARQPPAAGAERAAHGEFLSARQHSRELQVRHVRARDEQDAGDGAQKQVKAVPIVAHG